MRVIKFINGKLRFVVKPKKKKNKKRKELKYSRQSKKRTLVKEALLEKYGYYCALCGGFLTEDDITLDHIKPRSKGGSHHISNLQLAHSKCNNDKGDTYDKQ